MSTSRPIRSAGPWEYGLWTFTRLAGLALLLFGAFSMAMAFILGGRTLLDLPSFMRWMFFPNPNHVVNSNIPDVSAGWSNAFWQIYSILLMTVASGHAMNGLRMVLEDYIKRPLLVTTLRTALGAIWVAGMVVAVYVVLAS